MILSADDVKRDGRRKPRASGDDPVEAIEGWCKAVVNPARAGMIPVLGRRAPPADGKPRASGDDPPAEVPSERVHL